MAETKRLLLGVDGGGTETVACVADVSGAILGRGVAGASNHLRVGTQAAAEAISQAAEAALREANEARGNIAAAYLGLAGVGREADWKPMNEELQRLDLCRETVLDIDPATALAGATSCEPGLIVIAGTGAIAFGVDQSGRRVRCDGWGPLLGDCGSGHWIGRRALGAALRGYDGRGPQTALLPLVLEHFGAPDVDSLVTKVYAEPLTTSAIAAIARITADAAASGDGVAADILSEAGQHLAESAASVMQQLGLQEPSIAYSGGVFEIGQLVLGPFCRAVAEYSPGPFVTSPKYPPVVGAIMLAARHCGVVLAPGFAANLDRTLPENV